MAKREDEIKVVLRNPERLSVAKEKLMKFLYDEYRKKATSEDKGL